ncbi:class I SAM-dependent methyltransferase [Shewanella sp. Isolate11]|uniref:class I SAM-dependent methyltransferase n=1 Tax=Shewanella sp. Isolate11 TaxID=2908530 RepID=UPI001EFDCE23|nr:class I SAM-dependent methyltransferase [Shewanella sp. Isolate11]MCG9697628.1 class I SAM-dependent methyltransferase [Shewanella sp. Isolate11]
MEKKRLKAEPATLLSQHLHQLNLDDQSRVLDLACGSGRNGLYLAETGAQVTFIDRDLSRLEPIPANCLQLCVDLETDTPALEVAKAEYLAANQYDLILVFNYLHRPLFEQIKQAIKPGGFIVYETFINEQALHGRPKNPHFLLKPKELLQQFEQFAPLHYFEGNVGCEDKPCFKAQLIAQK